MKKKKNLEYFFNKHNIQFEKTDGGYFLWGWKEKVYSYRDAWRLINAMRNSRRWKRYLKENSNGKERAQLRDNLYHERFDEAETRQNKSDPWSFD